MYKIGDFSTLSKVTIKTLRYYENKGLLKPFYVDPENNYRYYDTSQLVEVAKIVSLRQLGISIKDIIKIQNGYDLKELLNKRKKEIENNLKLEHIQLSNLNYILENRNMKNEITFKELPTCIVYYKEGIIKDYSYLTEFILNSATECLKLNPNLKCIEPDYCYVNYLDGEYKENNIKVRYAQAVKQRGIENENIKFMEIKPLSAVCIYHKGSYNNLRDSYNIIMKFIEDNRYQIIDSPRECYIDGCWNKENEEDYLTEIQVPVAKK